VKIISWLSGDGAGISSLRSQVTRFLCDNDTKTAVCSSEWRAMKCDHVLLADKRLRRVFGFQKQVLGDRGQAYCQSGA
jgi:hypothetical protein